MDTIEGPVDGLALAVRSASHARGSPDARAVHGPGIRRIVNHAWRA